MQLAENTGVNPWGESQTLHRSARLRADTAPSQLKRAIKIIHFN